ncbi:MAG: mandelate racemase/muconate lactonizing enzyme family protein [Candidatus Poribacteria bacterium]|nr:mandelate racemase/muconate lactonizing enzyme family protein [Candidatus Poribacteria bacterium]
MTIKDIETHVVHVNHRGDWVFVQVHAEDGLTGVGEASHGRGDAGVVQIINELKPALIGWDVFQIEDFHRRFYHEHEGHRYHTAISGIEHALWALAGKALGVPAYRLLGGSCRQKIRLYANINRATVDRTPEGFAQNAQKAVEEGFTAIKCAPFDDASVRDISRGTLAPAVRMGIERIRRIRETIGPEVDLMVDCHSRFNPGLIIQTARELDDLHLFWVEDPVPLTDLDALSHVSQSTSMPIATGETLRTKAGFRRLLAQGAADFILPDIKHVGGILELKKIAAMAEAANVMVTPHNPSGPVATAASVQCMATVPNFAILEYAWGEVAWRPELVNPPERIIDGFIELSNRPGLGIDLVLPET